MVSPSDTTVTAMRQKVRRVTLAADESQLSDAAIDNYINTFYSQDFPYAIKVDHLRTIFTFYTEPFKDTYLLDRNVYQGIRDPIYVEGREGSMYKDEREFYRVWPKIASKSTQTVVAGNITAINIVGAPVCVVSTSATTGLQNGDLVTFTGIVGTTELNGNTYAIANLTANSFEVVQAGPTAYVSGGTWNSNRAIFTQSGYFLRGQSVIGGLMSSGSYEKLHDNGNPGLNNILDENNVVRGTVNYATGLFNVAFASPLTFGQLLTVWTCAYQPGRPFNLLYFSKNQSYGASDNIDNLVIRPVPDDIYKIEFEAYFTPTDFVALAGVGGTPIIGQWWQYIALGAAIKILQDRNDMETLENVIPEFKRQEALVLERQGCEEIGVRNGSLYTYASNNQYGGYGGWY